MVTKTTRLVHLENSIPPRGYGNRLSMYLIALEAWRRGIHVRFYYLDNPKNKMLIRYTLSFKGKEHFFESSMGDKLTEDAFEICENKDKTKQYLKEALIPVPEGRRFNASDNEEEIFKYAEVVEYPVVLKPISGNAGRGVFANINNESSLRDSLFYVRNTLGENDVIIEKHIPGVEYRILIVDGKVVGAINRVPANVVGNGKNSIKELIRLKNNNRKNNPVTSGKNIELDKEVLDSIHSLSYSLDSVPKKGERIFLRNKSNVSMGGDPIDVTDQLTDELKKIAVKAVKAVPGLNFGGLDMIVDKENDMGTVIEINTKPMIGLHVFPIEGAARDVVKPIVDYYFPETIESARSNLYFDFNAALAPIRNGITNYIDVLPPSPIKHKTGRRITVLIKNEAEVGYRRWIRSIALEQGLYGYVKKTEREKVEIVIVGNEQIVNAFIKVCLKGPEGAKIVSGKCSEWDLPIKLGFEIKRTSQEDINEGLRKEIKELKEKKKKVQKEKNVLLNEKAEIIKQIQELEFITNKCRKEKQMLYDKFRVTENERDQIRVSYDKIVQSRSWRYTYPLRRFFDTFRRKYTNK